jgi:hypothetical protein
MSNYRKGIRNKRRVRKYYEAQGWCVADVEDMSKYGSTDKFGVADLIVIQAGEVRLVQVKSNTPETQGVMQGVADRLQQYIPHGLESPFSDIKVDSSEVPNP